MPGFAKSPVQYFLLWASALIWLFPGHVSVFPASIKVDPVSIVIVLALGALCLGTRWRGANDPRLLFAMLALLMATAVSFMSYLIKPAEGLNAFYRAATAPASDHAPADTITRIEPTLDFGTGTTTLNHTTQAWSLASRIQAELAQFARPHLPHAGAVSASWEGFITVPAGVNRVEFAYQNGNAEWKLDNAKVEGIAQVIERPGVYKIGIRFQATPAATHPVSLRWNRDGVSETVPAGYLSPQRPNSVASDIATALQWLAFGVWLGAFGWALRVARPRWNGQQWLASGELAVLMLLPQRALARGGFKI